MMQIMKGIQLHYCACVCKTSTNVKNLLVKISSHVFPLIYHPPGNNLFPYMKVGGKPPVRLRTRIAKPQTDREI